MGIPEWDANKYLAITDEIYKNRDRLLEMGETIPDTDAELTTEQLNEFVALLNDRVKLLMATKTMLENFIEEADDDYELRAFRNDLDQITQDMYDTINALERLSEMIIND